MYIRARARLFVRVCVRACACACVRVCVPEAGGVGGVARVGAHAAPDADDAGLGVGQEDGEEAPQRHAVAEDHGLPSVIRIRIFYYIYYIIYIYIYYIYMYYNFIKGGSARRRYCGRAALPTVSDIYTQYNSI